MIETLFKKWSYGRPGGLFTASGLYRRPTWCGRLPLRPFGLGSRPRFQSLAHCLLLLLLASCASSQTSPPPPIEKEIEEEREEPSPPQPEEPEEGEKEEEGSKEPSEENLFTLPPDLIEDQSSEATPLLPLPEEETQYEETAPSPDIIMQVEEPSEREPLSLSIEEERDAPPKEAEAPPPPLPTPKEQLPSDKKPEATADLSDQLTDQSREEEEERELPEPTPLPTLPYNFRPSIGESPLKPVEKEEPATSTEEETSLEPAESPKREEEPPLLDSSQQEDTQTEALPTQQEQPSYQYRTAVDEPITLLLDGIWVYLPKSEEEGERLTKRNYLYNEEKSEFTYLFKSPGIYHLNFMRQIQESGDREERAIAIEAYSTSPPLPDTPQTADNKKEWGTEEERGSSMEALEGSAAEQEREDDLWKESASLEDLLAKLETVDKSPGEATIGLIEQIINSYPDYYRDAELYFELGTLYEEENNIKSFIKASEAYSRIIDNYPLSPYYQRAEERKSILDRYYPF